MVDGVVVFLRMNVPDLHERTSAGGESLAKIRGY